MLESDNSENILDKPNSNSLEIIQQKYTLLKKAAKAVEKDFKKVVTDEMNQNEWNKEKEIILADIKNLEKLKKEIEYILESEYLENNIDMENNIEPIKEYLSKIEKEIFPLLNKIKEKVKNYNIYEKEDNFGNSINSTENNNINNINNISNNRNKNNNNSQVLSTPKNENNNDIFIKGLEDDISGKNKDFITISKIKFIIIIAVSFIAGILISLFFTEVID